MIGDDAAVRVKCELPGCAAKAGEPCRNSETGRPRDEPHMSRVVRAGRGDPATQEWRQALGESTSARLRRVEAELGSALSALTRTEKERDDARAKAAHWLAKTRELAQDLAAAGVSADSLHVGAGRCAWRGLAVKVMQELELTRALLDESIADRARLRSEVLRVRGQRDELGSRLDAALLIDQAARIHVARGPSGTCVLCGGPIVRGQAVESVAGQTKPAWAHSACPDKESTDG